LHDATPVHNDMMAVFDLFIKWEICVLSRYFNCAYFIFVGYGFDFVLDQMQVIACLSFLRHRNVLDGGGCMGDYSVHT